MDVSERPRCKCHGEPMAMSSHWRCRIKKAEKEKRWRQKHPERVRERNARNNPRKLMVCGMYLGMCGFTKAETEGIVNGASD